MSKRGGVSLFRFAVLTLNGWALVASSSGAISPPPRVNLDRIPLTFEENRGQASPEVKFLARGRGQTVFFTDREIVFSLSKAEPQKTVQHRSLNGPREVVRMRFSAARANPVVSGEDELGGKNNYFIGSDPSKWRRGVASYRRVRYHELYPGIDAIFYGSQSGMEYDLVVTPGADPRRIRLAFDGVNRVGPNADGDLVLHTATGDLVQRRPVVYQETATGRREISGRYVRHGRRTVSFELAAYDRTKPIVLDPVLSWSTYLGGSALEYSYSIAVDDAGSVYVGGYTQSSDFPTPNGFDTTYAAGFSDGFVSKFDSAGGIVWSTYLGGSSDDFVQGIAVDSNHAVYLTGLTGSTDFPTMNPIQSCGCAHSPFAEDAFVLKLNAAGDALIYATWFGGGDYDEGDTIAVDNAGNAYVVGFTASTDFPTVNPIQPAYGGGPDDAWVAKFNAAGSAAVWATYLGGSNDEWGLGLAIDGSSEVFVTGNTLSVDFPTFNPIQASNGGGLDAFVTKISAVGDALAYSTYLGGSADDGGSGIAVDGAGNAYVVGATKSSDFPTKNPLQPAFGGATDVFAAKLDASGSHLIYATYFGGVGDDGKPKLRVPQNVTVDAAGDLYFGFITGSAGLPVVNAIQATMAGPSDGFAAALNASGNGLLFATYLGGTADDGAWSVTIDALGRPYLSGYTSSIDFPTKSPFQASNAGGTYDVWVASVAGPFVFSMAPASGSAAGGDSTTITGVDFQVGAVVTISGVPAPLSGVSTSTQIGVTSPPLTAGTLNDITVTNPDNNAATLLKGWFAEFADVVPADPFAPYIEKLFRNGITGGCGGGNYCPGNAVTRAQMAVFLLKGKHGSSYVPPPCTGIFPDVECTPIPAFAVDWIEELSNEAITGGCGGGNYCPGNPVNRAQMAVFLLKSEHGSTYVPPPCTGIFPDVVCPSLFADWIEELFNEAITGGCGGGDYCPTNPVTRAQMAVFLVKTFGLL